MPVRYLGTIVGLLAVFSPLSAAPPVASFVYPAGGQRGTTVPIRVGALFIHQTCQFHLDGKGVTPSQLLRRGPTLWFEGPVVPLPESQQAEDYPANLLGEVKIAADAPTGVRRGWISTSEGAASGLAFVVGELPEVVEKEMDGDPIPVPVTLPITANGRVFPREDVDLWEFPAKKGQSVSLLATTSAIDSPLVPKLEVIDPTGRILAEEDVRPVPGYDASARFVAPAEGIYRARISDPRGKGGPNYVYRLTITAGPVVDRTFPLGGRRGQPLSLQLSGQSVATAIVVLPNEVSGEFRTPLSIAGLSTNDVVLDVDDVPEFGPTIPAQPVAPPAVFNGTVGTAESPWSLSLKKGENYTFALKARQLGSPLCGVIAVVDASGTEVARSTPTADATADPTLSFKPAADGVFTVRVIERFRGRDGPEFAYRLKVSSSETTVAGFTLTLPVEVANVPRGGNANIKVKAVRTGGFTGPITVALGELPVGVTAVPTVIAAGQTDGTIKLSAEATAKVAAISLTVTGTGSVRTTVFQKRELQAKENLVVAVAVPAPFKVTGEYTMAAAPRGQVYRRKYTVERNGFEGPLEVRLAERQARHLQGVTAPVVILPAGQNEFTFTANLPPWMELGRTCRVCVMAVGIVKDPDGTEHPVTFSSVDQNQQLIVVAEPGRLDVELANPVVSISPGTTLTVPFRLSRAKGLEGPVRVELLLPAHWRGVSTMPVMVNGEVGELAVQIVKASGPFNMPVTIRATLLDGGEPVIAEAKLEILPAR